MSYAAVTTTEMELTPCRVTFGDGSPVDLGGTLENVVVSITYDSADIKADQMGTSVLDKKMSGLAVKVTTKLTQVLNKDIWKVAFPLATKVTSGLNSAIDFSSNIGASHIAASHKLVLHPLSLADANVSMDFTFKNAVATGVTEYTHSPTEQAGISVEWTILPDMTVTPAKWFRLGDPAIV
jgi:hypothetical protein